MRPTIAREHDTLYEVHVRAVAAERVRWEKVVRGLVQALEETERISMRTLEDGALRLDDIFRVVRAALSAARKQMGER